MAVIKKLQENSSSLSSGGAKTKRRVQILDILDRFYCPTKQIWKLWKNLSKVNAASKNGCNNFFLAGKFLSQFFRKDAPLKSLGIIFQV
jgi:hypothetical protein